MQSQKNEVTNNFRKIEKLCSMLSLSLPVPRFFLLSLWISAPSLWGLFRPCTVTVIINTNISLGICREKETKRPIRLNSGVSEDFWFNFDVSLTELHLSIFISVINQLDEQNLFYDKFMHQVG